MARLLRLRPHSTTGSRILGIDGGARHAQQSPEGAQLILTGSDSLAEDVRGRNGDSVHVNIITWTERGAVLLSC